MRKLTIEQLIEELKNGMEASIEGSEHDCGYLNMLIFFLSWWSSENKQGNSAVMEEKSLTDWYEINSELMFYIRK